MSFNFIEIAQIRQKAKAVGITPARYIREGILGRELKLKQFTQEQKELYRAMAGIANNINQIAKKFNQGDRPYNDLFKTKANLQILIDKLTGNDL